MQKPNRSDFFLVTLAFVFVILCPNDSVYGGKVKERFNASSGYSRTMKQLEGNVTSSF